jgi:uridine kinase
LKKIKPQLIAVVGGSGAGKTWLATKLQTALGKRVTRLSLDDFYRDRSHLPAKRRNEINFDHPRAIDWNHVERVLEKFAEGKPAHLPRYDFTAHARKSRREFVKPKCLIIMDGLWLLRRPVVRKFFSCRIFIDCPRRLRLHRRIKRDRLERGRNAANIRKQFLRQVVPMHDRFVASQSRWANIIFTQPGRNQISQLASKIESLLERNSI